MQAKFSRKLIVSVSGVVAGLAALAVVYVIYLRPYVKLWLEARSEINKRKTRLEELRTAFGNQSNPQAEISVLKQEIAILTEANKALKKVKTPGTESLPEVLEDPDEKIRLELYRDYLKKSLEDNEDNLKEKLRGANIPPPEFELYVEIDKVEEAAYYLNRATGLGGLVDAISKSRPGKASLTLDELSLEDYGEGNKRRDGAVNIYSYGLKMTMDNQTLISFLYNLQSQDSYYYVEDMQIEPRGGGGGSGSPQLGVTATVNTTMVFESQAKSQVKAAAEAISAAGKPAAAGGGMLGAFLMMQSQIQEEKAKAGQKKWYQFWKRSKKETTETEKK